MLAFAMGGCELPPSGNPGGEHPGPPLYKKYPGDLAVKWNQLEMIVSRTTPGFNAGRAFAYSGLTLYEAVVGGIPGGHSVASELIGYDVTRRSQCAFTFWPASGNAAMAYALRHFISMANPVNMAKIDSLENAFNEQFKKEVSPTVLTNSIEYGTRIAGEIFEWAATDGAAEAAAKNSTGAIPTGPGLWEPTPPSFIFPVNRYAKEVRTFIKNAPQTALAPPPIPYSAEVGSAFYNQVKYVYDYSQHLTADEITTVKTWGEFPGNYTQSLRYIQLGIQLVDEADLTLASAATAFAKHHMAVNDAVLSVFVSKYTYNQVRPITYIRGVMGFSTWNTVNTTPPHPEYPAAHATTGRASSRIMEIVFGKHYTIKDKTHANLYGVRTYSSPEAYSDEAGWSRVLGGIHYVPSVRAGKNMGADVANATNDLFTSSSH